MRFTRYFRPIRRPVTSRRLANARRAVEQDKASVALFPELAHYNSAEARLDDLDQQNLARVRAWRTHRAQAWRTARRRLRALDPDLRRRVWAHWQRGHLPGSPEYLLDLIHCQTTPSHPCYTPLSS
jgi:hypothetical protein